MTVHELQLPPCWQQDDANVTTQFVADIINTTDEKIAAITKVFQSVGLSIERQLVAEQPPRYELYFSATTSQAWAVLQRLLILAHNEKFDASVMPVNMEPIRLLVCDMDSTIVATETLDDLAEKANVGERIKEITTQAMCGEIDFIGALRERIRLLNGVGESLIEEVVAETRLNSGADALLTTARKQGIRTVLVSGGVEPVVESVAGQLGFDRYICNRLGVTNGKLNGKVMDPIVDANAKLQLLMEECAALGISTRQSCCIGDGANDLPMLQKAGIGISYMGKPLLRELLPYQVNYSDLAYAIPVLGIRSVSP